MSLQYEFHYLFRCASISWFEVVSEWLIFFLISSKSSNVMWCDVMWCDAILCDLIWCDMIWCDVVHICCGVMWWWVVWWYVMWCGDVWFNVVPYRVEARWLTGVVTAVLCLDLGEAQLGDRPAGVVGQTAQLACEVHQHLQQQILTRNILRSKFQSLKWWRRWH